MAKNLEQFSLVQNSKITTLNLSTLISLFPLIFLLLLLVAYASYQFGVQKASEKEQEWKRIFLEQQFDIDTMQSQLDDYNRVLSSYLDDFNGHLARLDALGGTLVEIAKIEDNRFDFTQPLAIGGAEESRVLTEPLSSDYVLQRLRAVSHSISLKDQQLTLLKEFLSRQEIPLAFTPDPALLPSKDSFYPVAGAYISSGFGWRKDPFTKQTTFHTGVDFAAKTGTPIVAVLDGTVLRSAYMSGYGYTVDLDHGEGLMTRYAHNRKNLVKEGDSVKRGDIIAELGSTGRSTGSHLHFEVRLHNEVTDPLVFLDNNLRQKQLVQSKKQ
jgi:murein DD-endopeptidase MepM/ murein hydrolase activator NlpD